MSKGLFSVVSNFFLFILRNPTPWDSEHHPGHQDNAMFLPEYREAGMFNYALTTFFPDLYQMCGDDVDTWGANCPHYFEGYRRRTNTISKLDGDMSTGGFWSKVDFGVWSRPLHSYDTCHNARKDQLKSRYNSSGGCYGHNYPSQSFDI